MADFVGKKVVVTTEWRGVFFGEVIDVDLDKRTIELASPRNCVYWSSDVKGFMGLATSGPTTRCKIGPAPEIAVFPGVTCIAECTDKATRAWEAAPWS